jgi:hypothetical protein
MASDLELLPVWYGGAGSYTLVRNMKVSQYMASLPKEFRQLLSSPMILNLMMKELFRRKKFDEYPNIPPLTAAIWGVSPRSIDILKELKQAGMDIEIPEWKEEYALLTKRQTSATCLSILQNNIPVNPPIKIPEFFSDIDGLRNYIEGNIPPYVIKTPLSSSGRGLYWIESSELGNNDVSWITGALKKQEQLSIEPGLDKVLDFAAEFYSDGNGEVDYVGLSIFETQAHGQFVGCMLGSQEKLQRHLGEYMSPEDYKFLVEQIRLVLKEVVGSSYTGFMGVDMFIYKTVAGNYAIHPFVELNLRYTMGLVAMQISHQFVHPESQGLLRIVYYVYNTLREHNRMMAGSPLIIDRGYIRSGYMSLCPVNRDTHYMAIIDVYE